MNAASASRGVTLEYMRRLMDSPEHENIIFPDSILEPTDDLLKNIPQQTLQTGLNQKNDSENNGTLIWENFQDLTNWCVDMKILQSEYDYHIGELATTKDTVTQYMGSDASELGKGSTTTFSTNIKENVIPSDIPAADQWTTVKTEMEGDKLVPVTPDAWLDIPALVMPDVGMQKFMKSKDNVSLTSYDCKQDDILQNINVGSDKFDLVSYLYEEESGTSASVTSSPSQNLKQEKDRTLKYRSDDCQSYTSSSATTSFIESSDKSTDKIVATRCSHRMRKRKYQADDDYEVDALNDDKSNLHISYSKPQQDSYRESREKNNEASRKSRMNKKAKEIEMAMEAEKLERKNRILKMKVDRLEKMVITMRKTLLESALNRRNHP